MLFIGRYKNEEDGEGENDHEGFVPLSIQTHKGPGKTHSGTGNTVAFLMITRFESLCKTCHISVNIYIYSFNDYEQYIFIAQIRIFQLFVSYVDVRERERKRVMVYIFFLGKYIIAFITTIWNFTIVLFHLSSFALFDLYFVAMCLCGLLPVLLWNRSETKGIVELYEY